MDFFKEKWFWIILLSAIAIVLLMYILKKKPSAATGGKDITQVAGTGCPSFSGLDKFGNPCPKNGAGCPNISGLDVYGNPCQPDCFNGCKSSKPGYDCDGNFSANC